jgi:FolB domain-containing protein
MDKIIIKDLLARGIIGVNDWERDHAQDILINLIVFADVSRAARTDDIADCVNYRSLAKKAQAHAEAAGRFTVEALANDLVELCLKEEGVQKAIVRVEKPGAVRFAASVGVEIERNRDA